MSINREPGEMSPLLENDDSSQSSNNTVRYIKNAQTAATDIMQLYI